MNEIAAQEYECKKCGHKWVSRILTTPKACPQCKAYHWDTAKKVKAVKS